MTPKEVSEALGISDNHTYTMLAQGVIPSIRLGRRIVIPRAAFEKWLESAAALQTQQ